MMGDKGACSFPHEQTADLDYSDGQFEAYWDLGRCIVEREWTFGTDVKPSDNCADSIWPPLQ